MKVSPCRGESQSIGGARVVRRSSTARLAVLVLGVANLLADGLSMGVGNYLGIRSDERVREAQQLPEQEAFPIRHGLATFIAFVIAGAVPLVPVRVLRRRYESVRLVNGLEPGRSIHDRRGAPACGHRDMVGKRIGNG